mgnify:CR=1 FL=1
MLVGNKTLLVFFLCSFPFILALIFAVYISQAHEAGT